MYNFYLYIKLKIINIIFYLLLNVLNFKYINLYELI